MIHTVVWLAVVEAVGWIAFPIAFLLFRNLPLRGYAFSKPLGMLLLFYPIWLGSTLHLIPNTRLVILAVLVVMGGVSIYLVRLRRLDLGAFIREEFKGLVVMEGVFLVLYAAWVALRMLNPGIESTEQPMDLAFFNASQRTHFFPPEDPWLKGHPVSYYYFGYTLMGGLAKLSGIWSPIAYNLALALIPALAGSAIAGLLYELVRLGKGSHFGATVAGIAAALFLVSIGNLEGILEVVRSQGWGSSDFWQWVGIKGLDEPVAGQGWVPREHWWWWRASRIIDTVEGGRSLDYTINEFPFFSFLLGDLHPHVMGIPFVLLFLGMLLNLWISPRFPSLNWLLSRPWEGIALGLFLGALGFINSWDLATFGLLFVGVALLKGYMHSESPVDASLVYLVVALGLIVLAVGLYFPFYSTFESQVMGLLPWRGPDTRPLHFAVIWGLFSVILVPFLLATAGGKWVRSGFDWSRGAIVAIAPVYPYVLWLVIMVSLEILEGKGGAVLGVAGAKLWHISPLWIAMSLLLYSLLTLARRRELPWLVFVLIMAFAGLLLLSGSELFYVADVFGNRMNTVFKLHYQAWILFAIASGYALYYLLKLGKENRWWRWVSYPWTAAIGLLFMASMVYSALAIADRASASNGLTLDGLAYLEQQSPGEYDAIKWLGRNAPRGSGIVEAVGGDYSAFGRISSSTGIPTVLGWEGHELQWRGSSKPFEGRADDVKAIFQTQNIGEAVRLLEKYHVEFVYVGSRERGKYGKEGLSKFPLFMDVVFQEGEVTIYRVRD